MKKLFHYIHQSYLLLALAIGVIAGTVLVMILRWNFVTSAWWAVLVILVFIGGYFWPNYLMVGLVFMAGMILAFWRSAEELRSASILREYVGQTALVSGTIVDDPDTDEGKTSLKLAVTKIGETEVSGKIYVSIAKNTKLERGDKVAFYGKLSEGFGTYPVAMFRPSLKELAKPDPPNPLLAMRNNFATGISNFIPEEEAMLGLAYVLGMKNGLSDELMEVLRVVGLTHIVVASGTHLSILVGAARKIFGKVSRFAGLLFSTMLILGFTTMIGWTASITRAALVSLLSLSAWYVGRKFEPYRLIILTMAITLMLNPDFLLNLGWMLSFASYTGIMILGPRLTEFFYGKAKPGAIASIVITTIAASLMCTPVLFYYYGTMSLISLVANLLILPTIPYAMGLVFLTGAVAWWPFLAGIVGKVATLMLDYHLFVMKFFGEQRMFLIEMPAENPWVFLLYIPILLPVIIAWIRRRRGLCYSSEWHCAPHTQ